MKQRGKATSPAIPFSPLSGGAWRVLPPAGQDCEWSEQSNLTPGRTDQGEARENRLPRAKHPVISAAENEKLAFLPRTPQFRVRPRLSGLKAMKFEVAPFSR